MAQVYDECNDPCSFFDKGSKNCSRGKGKLPKDPHDGLCSGYNGFKRVITPSPSSPSRANPNGPDNGDPRRWGSEID